MQNKVLGVLMLSRIFNKILSKDHSSKDIILSKDIVLLRSNLVIETSFIWPLVEFMDRLFSRCYVSRNISFEKRTRFIIMIFENKPTPYPIIFSVHKVVKRTLKIAADLLQDF